MNKLISLAVILPLTMWAATGQKGRKPVENRSVKTVVNNLGAEIAVTSRVKSDEDLRVVLTLSNESGTPFRLNATDLKAPSLVFKVDLQDGSPAPIGPPPTPTLNDGETGRVVLRPGEPLTETFSGASIFAARLKPGRYTISFSYSNAPGFPGEWVGSIETQPVQFEVIVPDLHVLR